MSESRSTPASPTQAAIIADYAALLAHTLRMREAAQDADWSSLIVQEADYVLEVERLARREAGLALDEAHRARKAELLEAILENHLEVRRQLVHRRDELGELIGTSRRRRELRRSYGAEAPTRLLSSASRGPEKPM